MPQSAEDSVRIAILSEPSAFGLSASDTNPMLLYQLRKNESAYSEQGTAELWKLCFDVVNEVLYAAVVRVFSGVDKRKHELVSQAIASVIQPHKPATRVQDKLAQKAPSTESQPHKPAPAKSNGKAKSNSKEAEASNSNGSRGGTLSVKQLRYMGFLYRKVGEEPDYTTISKLSQVEATMRIKELEQRVNR